ncbi:MAG: hypothetical protein IKE53_07085 [Clostridiales bacterium]|nr:hypothetical protein [Clostridiales bacterium]
MKKKALAVTITAVMILTVFSSCKAPDEEKIEETEITTVSETTVTESTVTETTTAETTAAEPVHNGGYVTFGHYEQDGDESNGAEPIEWIVLSEEDGRTLLISRYILDYQPYNEEFADVTWETCTLRAWLNNDFLNAAFDASEQEQIITVTNSNPDNESPFGVAEGGNDTEDKVFLLSSDEADALFPNDDARAVDRCEWWWLRSPGYISLRAAVVLTIGEIYTHGHTVSFNYFDHGVRPALWADLGTEEQ